MLVTCIYIHIHNLRNYLTALLDIDTIANMQVKVAYEILIVQGGSAHNSPRKLYGVHIRYWCNCSSSSNLEGYLTKNSRLLFSHELIGNGPSRALGSHPQASLLSQRVYLQHDAIRSNREVLTLLVPKINIFVYLLQRTYKAHLWTNLESPLFCLLKVVIMTFTWDVFSQKIIEIGIKLALCNHG